MDPFEHLLARAGEDPEILAVILGGGRGKGVVTPASDWDCDVIVTDGSTQRVEARLADLLNLPAIDGGVIALTELRAYAEFGTPEVWDRYGFAHAQVPLDKTEGLVTDLVREKGRLPAEATDSVLRTELDAYVNAVYRSLKNARDGRVLSSRLDATESIPAMLAFLFALDGRVRPYNKFLEWELANHPLTDLPVLRDEFLEMIDAVMTTADAPTQRRLFALIEPIAIARGMSDLLETWGDDLKLLRESR
jgi:hypothetical protein